MNLKREPLLITFIYANKRSSSRMLSRDPTIRLPTLRCPCASCGVGAPSSRSSGLLTGSTVRPRLACIYSCGGWSHGVPRAHRRAGFSFHNSPSQKLETDGLTLSSNYHTPLGLTLAQLAMLEPPLCFCLRAHRLKLRVVSATFDTSFNLRNPSHPAPFYAIREQSPLAQLKAANDVVMFQLNHFRAAANQVTIGLEGLRVAEYEYWSCLARVFD